MPENTMMANSDSTGQANPVQQTSSADIGSNNQPSQSQPSTNFQQADNGKFDVGDGNIFNPKNYIPEGLSPEIATNIEKGIKKLQSEWTKKTQSIASMKKEFEGKKYAFANAKEALELIEKDENFKSEIQKEIALRDQLNQSVDNIMPDMNLMIQNWDGVPDHKKNEYMQKLSPTEQVTFVNGLKFKQIEAQNQIAQQQSMISGWDESNSKKYSDYNINQVNDFLRDSSKFNPREMAYLIVSREKYGKDMYEKGKMEANKLSLGIQTTENMRGDAGSGSNGVKISDNVHDNFMTACKMAGIDPTKIDFRSAR